MVFPDIPDIPRPLPAPGYHEIPKVTARTLEGLEWILKTELENLGAVDFRVGRRTVEFSAPRGHEREVLYRSVLESRTAIRILEPLGRFRVDSPEALYDAVKNIDWAEQCDPSDSLRVDARIHDTFLTHSLYAAQVVKDAIVDQFRERFRKRPSVQLRGATLRLSIHLVGHVATVFRDAAGRSLHQRGWRVKSIDAPLSEPLAAGVLACAGWWQPHDLSHRTTHLLDPFCGSGTFLIEAASISGKIAPGLWRAREQGHGFFRFKDFDHVLANRLVDTLESRVQCPDHVFYGSDLDPQAVLVAKANAQAAGVLERIVIEQKNFEDVRSQAASGFVVTNPPYGERLPVSRSAALFRRIGDWLVHQCGGWNAVVLAADISAVKHLGLRPSFRCPLKNGPIQCRLTGVEIRRRVGREEKLTIAKESSVCDSQRVQHTECKQSETTLSDDRASSVETGIGSAGRRQSRSIEHQIIDFRRRLAKRFKHLSKWARRQEIEAFRLYDRDIPEIPLVIEIYAGWLHAAEYDRPHGRTDIEHDVWLSRMMEAAAEELGIVPSHVFLKARRRQRFGNQYEKLQSRKVTHSVREGGLVFEVNLSDYLDTGLFLDHRQTRAMIRSEAKGKRFLNLFSYTGSFSVYAAAGGAAETTSVDLSNTYLDWTRTNLITNSFVDTEKHRLVRDDVRDFLEYRQLREEPPFDLIVVDPPTFSRSAKSTKTWEVERDHADLLASVAKNLVSSGVVFFSTNYKRFHFEQHRIENDYTIREITRQTIPEDFRNQRIHRTWRLIKK